MISPRTYVTLKLFNYILLQEHFLYLRSVEEHYFVFAKLWLLALNNFLDTRVYIIIMIPAA